ncbi:MAG: LPS export ABC transporter periplasmic protein LptC [Acetobacteraceae bacterium]
MTARPASHFERQRLPQDRHRLIAAATARIRRAPSPGGLARRRVLITLTKWLLPAAALALLTAIAIWPEFERATEQARVGFRRFTGEVEGGRLVDASYHGVDRKNRPYTVTAATARQVTPDRIDLTQPKADMTLEDGTWLMLQSKNGTYLRNTNQLDLWQDVTLYRDDGMTITTKAASIDLVNGAAAGGDPVHVEGPFGILDAQGFAVIDKGEAIQFTGPAHVVMNGSSP